MAVSNIYTGMLKNRKLLLMPDVAPWASINTDPHLDILDGIVKSVSTHCGANIGSAEIQLPKKVFGDLVEGHLPIKIAVDTADNVIFRGFIVEDTGTLSESDDSVNVKALDYKWYFSKITRIRGKYFTTLDSVPNIYSSPNGIGSEKLKHEMFKGTLIADGGSSGYLQDSACIFNEGGKPNCATGGKSGVKCVFKERKVWVKDGVQYVSKMSAKDGEGVVTQSNFGAYYWTYKSILAHIAHWWLGIYSCGTTAIRIKDAVYAKLDKLKSDQLVPYDLSIEDNNPLEALDKVVKAIPGRWVWWLEYNTGTVWIDLKNIDDTAEVGKVLTVGEGKKMATNPVTLSGITVTRNTEESVRYVILKGGSIKLTTTVELYPLSAMHDVGGITCPFLNINDFNAWRTYALGKSNTENKKKNKDKKNLRLDYEQPYRYYCVPVEGALLKQALSAVSSLGTENFTDVRYKRYYDSIESDFKKMFVNGLWIDRKLDRPCNVEFSKPIIFSYDIYHNMDKTLPSGQGVLPVGNNNLIFYEDSEFSFDGETGLVIFDKTQHCRFRTGNTKVETDATVGIIDSLEVTDKQADDMFEGDHPLLSRRIFATLSIKLDLPFVYGDTTTEGIVRTSGSNFSRYIDLESQELEIHSANTYYPYQANSTTTLKNTGSLTLAREGNTPDKFECLVYAETNAGGIYPAIYMSDYEKFPHGKDKVMIQKMDSYLSSLNWCKENISAELGILNTTYKIGDIITSIVNSETENANSGYFNLRDYVSTMTITLAGETRGYSTALSITNDINYTPAEFGKVMENRVPTPANISNSSQIVGIAKGSETYNG